MGLPITWGQSNVSVNTQKGTMRGLHYQSAPNEEAKLTRCTAGAIYGLHRRRIVSTSE
ncbi:MAG: dTDP-4-dehydrorhamnose 3,5-epimerase [Nitrospira sp.]|nr:dTDP-4-dehydrorhamnose 3,5-epimerase [Nitrospira sp.]